MPPTILATSNPNLYADRWFAFNMLSATHSVAWMHEFRSALLAEKRRHEKSSLVTNPAISSITPFNNSPHNSVHFESADTSMANLLDDANAEIEPAQTPSKNGNRPTSETVDADIEIGTQTEVELAVTFSNDRSQPQNINPRGEKIVAALFLY